MNSREKGKRGERELAQELARFGFKTRRGQQYNGADGSADVIGIPGLHIECKRAEALNLEKALHQAEEDAKVGELPAVFHRRNREGWKVTVRLKDFVWLWKRKEEADAGRSARHTGEQNAGD